MQWRLARDNQQDIRFRLTPWLGQKVTTMNKSLIELTILKFKRALLLLTNFMRTKATTSYSAVTELTIYWNSLMTRLSLSKWHPIHSYIHHSCLISTSNKVPLLSLSKGFETTPIVEKIFSVHEYAAVCLSHPRLVDRGSTKPFVINLSDVITNCVHEKVWP